MARGYRRRVLREELTDRLFLLTLGIVLALASGCSSVPIPPPYTQEELRQRCEHVGGWWRPDALMGGYCELESASFL